MLWLTKASIVQTGGTKNEATRWDPTLKMYPLNGSDSKPAREMVFKMAVGSGACILTNYETLRTTPEARKVDWDIVVMDEVHKLKGGANANGATAIWTTVKDTLKSANFIMMLTGTPLVNRVEEIWSYLHIFDPVVFPDARRFARQFSAFKDVSGKMQFSLQSERLLKDILKGRLIRRTAHEVGLQMPPVNYQDIVLPHNLEQGDIYQQMRKNFFIWLESQEKPLSAVSLLAQMTRLRQINVLPVANFTVKDAEGNIIETVKLDVRDSSKLDEAVDIITQTDDQVIVFCTFNEPLNELAFRLQVNGLRGEVISSETTKQMSAFEIGFQNKEIDVLLINSAMGEGMNLHKDIAKWEGGARAVIMLDRWWNPARNRQCIARAVRPETDQSVKEREPVMVYNLFCDGSIDYFIQALLDEKAAQFDSITESKELRHPTEWRDMLKKLL
jgi:SNF2 family DNA or RNA helicase